MNKKSFFAGFIAAFLVGGLLGMGTGRMSQPSDGVQAAGDQVVLILDKDFGTDSLMFTGANVGVKYPEPGLEQYVVGNAPKWEQLIKDQGEPGAIKAEVIVRFHASPGCVYFQGKIYC